MIVAGAGGRGKWEMALRAAGTESRQPFSLSGSVRLYPVVTSNQPSFIGANMLQRPLVGVKIVIRRYRSEFQHEIRTGGDNPLGRRQRGDGGFHACRAIAGNGQLVEVKGRFGANYCATDSCSDLNDA
ncbi:MAG: hypothetical protein LBF50_00410, partial [Azoarcus sp.]|nr:hypothetical protein [Azoarcus sp.]